MSTFAAVIAIAVLVSLIIIVELVAAVVPIIVIVTLVPAEERIALAQLLANADSSRRLRLWPALRAAVIARRLHQASAGKERSAL
jgi:hypothetical protein